ncbi:MFS transporter [Nonomuraea rosea]|uniref:MFS transporter n=1 Tax=Nonomuraea rosea TaxID=638574 RepID=A0ABP6ZB17_9ACTN
MAEIVPLRRNLQFQLLWIGSAVSQVGMELTKLAMPLLVLALTGSPGWAGIVAGARTAASIAAQLPAGVWVDRWDRRRTLIAGQGLQTVVAAALAVLILTGQVSVWHLIVLGMADGVCAAFIGPARTTAIRGVVPVVQLPSAFAQEEARGHAARLIGPPLGALLYGLGRAVPFLVDAVTFLVAMLCALFAKVPRRAGQRDGAGQQDGAGWQNGAGQQDGTGQQGGAGPQDGTGQQDGAERPAARSMREEVAEAVGWLWRQPGLRAVCVVAMMLNLLGSAFLLPLIVLVGERGGSALNTGTVLAGVGIGGLAGALLAGRAGTLLPPGRLTITFAAVFGLSIAAMALPFGPWWPMVPLMLFSVTTPAFNVVIDVVITRLVPESMLGRVDAALSTVGFGLAPLGPVVGGALAAALGGAASLVVIGGLLLLTSAGAALSGELRRFTGAEEPDEVRR